MNLRATVDFELDVPCDDSVEDKGLARERHIKGLMPRVEDHRLGLCRACSFSTQLLSVFDLDITCVSVKATDSPASVRIQSRCDLHSSQLPFLCTTLRANVGLFECHPVPQ